MNMKTDCKYCGESIETSNSDRLDEYTTPDGDYAHFECQMDYEELTAYSPVDLF